MRHRRNFLQILNNTLLVDPRSTIPVQCSQYSSFDSSESTRQSTTSNVSTHQNQQASRNQNKLISQTDTFHLRNTSINDKLFSPTQEEMQLSVSSPHTLDAQPDPTYIEFTSSDRANKVVLRSPNGMPQGGYSTLANALGTTESLSAKSNCKLALKEGGLSNTQRFKLATVCAVSYFSLDSDSQMRRNQSEETTLPLLQPMILLS